MKFNHKHCGSESYDKNETKIDFKKWNAIQYSLTSLFFAKKHWTNKMQRNKDRIKKKKKNLSHVVLPEGGSVLLIHGPPKRHL